VPKVQYKPIKSPKKGSNKEKQNQPKAALIWRTGLSGVPPDSVRCTRENNYELLSFGFLEMPLRYNSPDCLVYHAEQRLTAPTVVCKSEQCVNSARTAHAESEQAPEGAPDSEQGLSGGPTCQSSNGRTLTVG
jgi:hypothetical protein